MRPKVRSIIILLIISLLVVGCVKANASKESNVPKSISDCITYLTSDECEGRYPGTPGNLKAQEYIINRMKEIELDPFEGNYLFSYEKPVVEINTERTLIEVPSKNVTLEYGVDYVESNCYNLDITQNLSSNLEEINDVLLLKDFPYGTKDSNKRVYLLLDSKFERSSPFVKPTSKYIFRISENGYEKLKECRGDNIHVKIKSEEKLIDQNHIVSMIPGENTDLALVISAHFDHIGEVKNLIWRGALDNASGVSSMLYTAEELKKYYKDKKPPINIIFAAFNSEECINPEYTHGSKFFADYLSSQYSTIYNINIDCVGNKLDFKSASIDLNAQVKDSRIADLLLERLNNLGYDTDYTNGSVASDHSSFKGGLNISTKYFSEHIHHIGDTSDILDIEYIYQLSQDLSSFIIDNIDEFKYDENLVNKSSNASNDKVNQIINTERENLEFGSFKYINIDEYPYIVGDNVRDVSISSLKNDNLIDLTSILDFANKDDLSGYVFYNLPLIFNAEKYELNKVYSFDQSKDNIVIFNFNTANSNSSDLNTFNIEIINVTDTSSILTQSLFDTYTNEEQLLQVKKENITCSLLPIYSTDDEGNTIIVDFNLLVEFKDNEQHIMMRIHHSEMLIQNGINAEKFNNVNNEMIISSDEFDQVLESEKVYNFIYTISKALKSN